MSQVTFPSRLSPSLRCPYCCVSPLSSICPYTTPLLGTLQCTRCVLPECPVSPDGATLLSQTPRVTLEVRPPIPAHCLGLLTVCSGPLQHSLLQPGLLLSPLQPPSVWSPGSFSFALSIKIRILNVTSASRRDSQPGCTNTVA